MSAPLLAALGGLTGEPDHGRIQLDAGRAVATSLKPVDEEGQEGVILRLWETSGPSGPLSIPVQG